MTWAANWSATGGRAFGSARMSPRAMSISSLSVSVTASPASADATSAPETMTRTTRVVRPDPETATASPGATRPPAIVPA